MFDDFECSLSDLFGNVAELVSGIFSVSECTAQPIEAVADGRQHQPGTVTVLNVSAVNERVDEIATVVGKDVTLASLDLLASIIAVNPAAFSVLTFDYRSRLRSEKLPALGLTYLHQQIVVEIALSRRVGLK